MGRGRRSSPARAEHGPAGRDRVPPGWGPRASARNAELEEPMAQQPVEMILVRQLAGYLYVPVLVVDATGTVIFYNEPAERILGLRFEETGPIDPEEADRLVELSDDPTAGPQDAGIPVLTALQQRRPAHSRRWLL